jgi:hypothetical protein
MSSKNKRQVFTLPAQKYLDVSLGHGKIESQGCGRHDNRPKRLRTRGNQNKSAIREWNV